jgi:ion channel POLLUX/CASTOR
MILAHMVAQVALRRELRAVFDELFTAGGPELIYRPASSYGLTDEPQRFLDLQSCLRLQGETLIGVYHASRDTLELNPPAHAGLTAGGWRSTGGHDDLYVMLPGGGKCL